MFLIAEVASCLASIVFCVIAISLNFGSSSRPSIHITKGEVLGSGSSTGMAADQNNLTAAGAGTSDVPRTLEAMCPGTDAKRVVELFTQAGFAAPNVNRILVERVSTAKLFGDSDKEYIQNAIEVVEATTSQLRESTFNKYHEKRMDALRDAEERAAREKQALAVRKQNAYYALGFSILVILQASLILCVLGIERNTRR